MVSAFLYVDDILITSTVAGITMFNMKYNYYLYMQFACRKMVQVSSSAFIELDRNLAMKISVVTIF